MNRRVKKFLSTICLIFALGPGIALAQSASAWQELDCGNRRGRIVGSEFIRSATREEIAQFLAAIGWPSVGVRSGVTMRRLVYTTIDAHGAPTVASGLLALPTDVPPYFCTSRAIDQRYRATDPGQHRHTEAAHE